MCDYDWVKFAMADDSIVADILLRLRLHHRPPLPPPPSLHLHWTVRQRRSRSVPKHAAKPDSTRASPTTPLSWSGATSASGGAVDGFEESSYPTKLAESSRSKVANPRETVTTKRSRKKKTLAELKEEESFLLKERGNLKNELASLRLTVEKGRAANESLKRMKLDLEPRRNSNAATASKAECHNPSNSISPETVAHKVLDDHSPVNASTSPSKAQVIGNQGSTCVLPDLNLPVDEDFSSNPMH